ncbi:hypothetical protein F5890DRAFT_1439723 [Lentinula detonsa]|uniref:TPR-like protein n=1 Tax=Lentinula detonsa TaxID=2804962 RepID=A0AA38Q026_9AGAR|nr:hypothetical protein F5890DRAFT_1439723 [Lentinula detonsa]
MEVKVVEKALLTGQWEDSIPQTPAVNVAQAVVRGRFGEALTSSYAQQLFKFRPADTLKNSFNVSASLTQDKQENELLRLVFAVACLNAFMQVNWTGPDLDFRPFDILSHTEPRNYSDESLNQLSIAELASGGEPAYHLTQHALFLRLAQILLDAPYQHCQTTTWWRLRAHLAHQRVLDEPVILSDDVMMDFKRWQNPFASNNPDMAGRLLLEHGLLHHTFQQDKIAAEYFVKAARATDLQYELTGALGKRTKFQQNELSQLVLLAESHLPDEGPQRIDITSTNGSSQAIIPETLALNDDTLLEQTEFTSSKSSSDTSSSSLHYLDPSNQPPLHPLDQCILLSLCLNVRNTSPLHGLTSEQMSPYVSRVVSHPRNWTIHTMALLIRSRLEANRTRTVERSALQLQALVDQIPATDAEAAPASERLRYLHSISLPPKWELERELANRFISLGVIKSAMDIYERLEMWEEVVKCHVSLERPDRGIAIVKDLLAGNKIESEAVISREKASGAIKRLQRFDSAREAKLWCILGDLDPENAVEHYKHAWEISKSTSGRAMRSLGGFYFARAEYELARECLQQAVKIEPLLSKSWFILGCTCMRLEDWQGAKDAFARCVTIDEEDGESWSNIASMYLRIEQSHKHDDSVDTTIVPHSNKQLAFRALKEGLKRSYDNWRMWSNYMIIAVDVGELAEACRALGRVVEETSNKPDDVILDEDVLDRLVNAVTRVSSDPQEAGDSSSSNQAQPATNPNEGRGLQPRVLDLFDRIILPRVSSARVFRAYARLLTWMGRWEDTMKAWMDAYRESDAGKLSRGEINTVDAGRTTWRDAIDEVEEIVDILKNLGARLEASGSTKKWRLQAKSIVRSFMARTREDFEDDTEWHRLEELLEELKQE